MYILETCNARTMHFWDPCSPLTTMLARTDVAREASHGWDSTLWEGYHIGHKTRCPCNPARTVCSMSECMSMESVYIPGTLYFTRK